MRCFSQGPHYNKRTEERRWAHRTYVILSFCKEMGDRYQDQDNLKILAQLVPPTSRSKENTLVKKAVSLEICCSHSHATCIVLRVSYCTASDLFLVLVSWWETGDVFNMNEIPADNIEEQVLNDFCTESKPLYRWYIRLNLAFNFSILLAVAHLVLISQLKYI